MTVEALLAADIVGCPGELSTTDRRTASVDAQIVRKADNPDLAAMMNPASRELLGKDRSTSETGHRSYEAMAGAQFRNVVGFLGRPTTTDRRVDAMGQNVP